MSEEHDSPFFQISLDLYDNPLVFSSPEDVKQWIDHEREFWSWAKGPPNSPVTGLYNQSQAAWQKMESTVQQYIATTNESQQTAYLVALKKEAAPLNNSGIRLVSTDSRAQYVARIAESDPTEASHVLQAFVNPKPNPSVSGAVLAQLFSLGVTKDTAAAERDALAQNKTEWDSFVAEAMTTHEKLKKNQEQLTASGDELLTDKRGQFDAALEKCASDAEELFTAAKTELKSITETYDQHLAVKSSVSYWTERAKTHRERTTKNAWSFVVVAIVGIALIVLEVVYWLLPAMAQDPEFMKSYWPAAILVASAGFVFWVLRIVARLFLSNVHLATAAEERMTMVNTFLALLRSQEALTEADRRVIMDALFRFSATGIVKDDAAPPTSLDIVTKPFTGK